jgi:hypothetical protein
VLIQRKLVYELFIILLAKLLKAGRSVNGVFKKMTEDCLLSPALF